MNRTIILNGSDSDSDLTRYFLVAWRWNVLGWDTLFFYRGKTSILMERYKAVKSYFEASRNTIIPLPQIDGHNSEDVIALSKYFAGCCISEARLAMTSPLELLPVKENAWTASESPAIYSYEGQYQFSATSSDWRTRMGIADKMGLDLEIKKILDHLKREDLSAQHYIPSWLVPTNSLNVSILNVSDMIDLAGKSQQECNMELLRLGQVPGWLKQKA